MQIPARVSPHETTLPPASGGYRKPRAVLFRFLRVYGGSNFKSSTMELHKLVYLEQREEQSSSTASGTTQTARDLPCAGAAGGVTVKVLGAVP
jgi:hypothetical protein